MYRITALDHKPAWVSDDRKSVNGRATAAVSSSTTVNDAVVGSGEQPAAPPITGRKMQLLLLTTTARADAGAGVVPRGRRSTVGGQSICFSAAEPLAVGYERVPAASTARPVAAACRRRGEMRSADGCR